MPLGHSHTQVVGLRTCPPEQGGREGEHTHAQLVGSRTSAAPQGGRLLPPQNVEVGGHRHAQQGRRTSPAGQGGTQLPPQGSVPDGQAHVPLEQLPLQQSLEVLQVPPFGRQHGPSWSPWRWWLATALGETSLVSSSGVPGLWQMVTFCC